MISPATPLPAISDTDTALSGLTQTAFTGDTAAADTSSNATATTGPEVVINLGTIASGAANKGPGLLITGRVFRDDGSGAGLEAVRVELRDAANALLASALTDGTGAYNFAVPAGASGNVRVVELNSAEFISTGAGAGNTGGSYDRATDTISFVLASGQSYSGLNFGDAPQSTLTTDGASIGTRGTSVFYPHVFTAGSAGNVTFTLGGTATPVNGECGQRGQRDVYLGRHARQRRVEFGSLPRPQRQRPD